LAISVIPPAATALSGKRSSAAVLKLAMGRLET
jgi:hypothetical protein